MVDHSEYDESGISNKYAHLGFHGYFGRPKLSVGYDVWHFLTYAAMVQAEDWPYRLYANITYQSLASGVRTPVELDLPGKQLLHLAGCFLLRPRYLRYRGRTYLRRL